MNEKMDSHTCDKVAWELREQFYKITAVAIKGTPTASHGLQMGIAGGMGGIEAVATIIMKNRNPKFGPTDDQRLLAALITCACYDGTPDDKAQIEITADRLNNAFLDYEKLTGRKAQEIVSETLFKFVNNGVNVDLSSVPSSVGQFLPH